jgi:hypothetical protein
MKGKRRYIRGFDFYGRTNDPKEGMTVVPRKQSSMPAGPSVRSGSTSDNRGRRRVLNSANATRADLPLLLLSVLLRRRCWLQALSDKAVNTAASIALDSIGATSPPCHPRPSRAVQRLPLPTVSHHGLVPLSQLCRRLSSDPFVPASSSCHFPKWLPLPFSGA